MKKSFSTLAVLGAYSGYVMEEKGFVGIHSVFDHLYPGIMTLGVAAMADKTKQYLRKSVPGLSDLPEVNGDNCEEVGRLAVKKFGATIEIDGPIENISPLTIEMDYLHKHTPNKSTMTHLPSNPKH